MALTGALCSVVHAVTGFTNQSLRGLVAGLLGHDYTTNQMSYDLRRLRLHGLIERIPHTKTYALTPDGTRIAVFYPNVHDRILRPLLAAPTNPPHLSSSAAPSPQSTASSTATTSPPPPRGRRLKLVTTSQVPHHRVDPARANGNSCPALLHWYCAQRKLMSRPHRVSGTHRSKAPAHRGRLPARHPAATRSG